MAGRKNHWQLTETQTKSSMEVGKGWQGERITGSWQRSIYRVAWRLEKTGREAGALAVVRKAYKE